MLVNTFTLAFSVLQYTICGKKQNLQIAVLIKWPNTLKQFVDKLPTNCLSVFGIFVNLALKGITPRSEDIN